eukprot:COSAG06_NODE_2813_length_6243_cov_7.236165_7_plen_60_part_00
MCTNINYSHKTYMPCPALPCAMQRICLPNRPLGVGRRHHHNITLLPSNSLHAVSLHLSH